MARVALITGGAKGIGRAIGLDLAAAGWDIALCYLTSEREAAETASRITQVGRRALAEQCDVSDAVAGEAFVRKVEKEFGAVDALINCAGPYHRINILDETPAGWTAMFAHNLHSVFYMSKAVTPGMKSRKAGRIISFSMANADQVGVVRFLLSDEARYVTGTNIHLSGGWGI